LIPCRLQPALWYKKLANDGLMIVLQYSDDMLSASTDSVAHLQFKKALAARFEIETNDQASWYLQARIHQTVEGNITLDQSRYARSIVECYLPNAPAEPSPADLDLYQNPLPSAFKWTKTDCSATDAEVTVLETDFDFRAIAIAGSFNYLANTAFEEFFSIRKLCSFIKCPGHPHFKAALHMLHHLRCYSPKALCFYRDVYKSLVATMLREAGHDQVDPSFVWFVDLSWGDCDDQCSTGCYIGMLQGASVDHNSFVPDPITLLSAEAETNSATVGIMSGARTRMIYLEVLTGNPDHPYTVPVFSDRSAAITISRNERGTHRTRHIARRYLYCCQANIAGDVQLLHISGDKHQLADLGTKNVPAFDSAYKLSIVEVPLPGPVAIVCPHIAKLKRGDGAEAQTDDPEGQTRETSESAQEGAQDS
jgi:hypothetical protein